MCDCPSAYVRREGLVEIKHTRGEQRKLAVDVLCFAGFYEQELLLIVLLCGNKNIFEIRWRWIIDAGNVLTWQSQAEGHGCWEKSPPQSISIFFFSRFFLQL